MRHDGGHFLKMVKYFASRYADNYDSVCIKLGDRDETLSDGKTLKMEFDKNNGFIKNNDEDGMKVKILRAIFSATTRMSLPGFVLVSMADRKIIREGFSRELTCYYFCTLSAKKRRIENFGDFLEINLPWISFKGNDEYNSLFFRQLLCEFEYDKKLESETEGLFGLLSRPLTSSVLNQIISECSSTYGEFNEKAGNKI